MKKEKFKRRPGQDEPVDEFLRNRKERSEREYRRPNNDDVRRWQTLWDNDDSEEYDDA